jgi:hypothetical protein
MLSRTGQGSLTIPTHHDVIDSLRPGKIGPDGTLRVAAWDGRYSSKPLTGFGEGHRVEAPSNVGYSMIIR